MRLILSILLASSAIATGSPAAAQTRGVGGTGVDEASTLTTCTKPLGTIALVEEKAKGDPRLDALPPGMRAMMDMAQVQQGGGSSVDPLPLLKLLAARSRCFVMGKITALALLDGFRKLTADAELAITAK